MNKTLNVVFENIELCKDFSSKLWNAYDTIPHGLIEDGYIDLQPIVISDKIYNQKEICIIVNNFFEYYDNFEKIFFVFDKKMNFNRIEGAKYFSFINGIWNESSNELCSC